MAKVASIETTLATDTSTGVEGGKDVGFDLTLDDGTVLSGEVTLLPHEDGRPGYASWGAPDNWLDGATLAKLRKTDLLDSEFRNILEAIEGACAERAEDDAEAEANHDALDSINLGTKSTTEVAS
jgi:hypothetical protein